MGGNGKQKGSGKGAAKKDTAPTSLPNIPEGTSLTAQSGAEWYKATVVQVRKKAPQVKVHYDGYDASYDEWLGLDQLRSKLLKDWQKKEKDSSQTTSKAASGSLPGVGAKCQAQTHPDGKFFPAEVVAVSAAKAKEKAPVKIKVEMWVPLVALKSVQEVAETKVAAASVKEAASAEAAVAPALPKVGAKGEAKYLADGAWYKAEVLQVSESQKRRKAPVKVHFIGWDASEDIWVSLDEMRKFPKVKGASKPEAKVEEAPKFPDVGAKGEAKFALDGAWYKAEVVQTSTSKKRSQAPVKIHFTGWEYSEDAWVSLDEIRKFPKPKAAPAKGATAEAKTADKHGLTTGLNLTAQFTDGEWYKATVVKLRKGATPVKVHYAGHEDSSDRWVSLDEIRSKALKTAS